MSRRSDRKSPDRREAERAEREEALWTLSILARWADERPQVSGVRCMFAILSIDEDVLVLGSDWASN